MLMIRFQRIGRVGDPAFRISVLEKERAAQAGRIVEQVGTYNPRTKAVTLDEEAVKGWIAKGAQPTGSVRNLLITKGVITGKKVNVLPKKTPPKKEEPEAPAPAATAAKAPTADAVAEEPADAALPSEAETAADAEPAAEEAPAAEKKAA
jgi:small subunit ribosomal protein S16